MKKILKKTLSVLCIFVLVFTLSSCSSNKNDMSTVKVTTNLKQLENNVDFGLTINYEEQKFEVLVKLEMIESDKKSLVDEKKYNETDFKDEKNVITSFNNLSNGFYDITYDIYNDDYKDTKTESFVIDKVIDDVDTAIISEKEKLLNDAYFTAVEWYGNFQAEVADLIYNLEKEDLLRVNGDTVDVNESTIKNNIVSKEFNYLSILTYINETDLDLVEWLTDIEDNLSKIYYYKISEKTNKTGLIYNITIPDISNDYSALLAVKDPLEKYTNLDYKTIFKEYDIFSDYIIFSNPLSTVMNYSQTGGYLVYDNKTAKFTKNFESKYKANVGSRVYVPFDGEVIGLDKANKTYFVTIESQVYGKVTIKNLERVEFQVGAQVKAGDLLAEVGETIGPLGVALDYINVFYHKDGVDLNFDMYLNLK